MEREGEYMPRKSFSKKNKLWDELKKHKRASYNPKYNKKKEDDQDHDSTEFENPDDVTLDRAIKFIRHGYGEDLTIEFKDDVTQEEINTITSKFKQVLGL